MRDMPAEKTVQLDVPEVGVTGGRGQPEFQDASADDSRVYFTDGTRLTSDATESEAIARDLYVFEVTGGGPLQGRLVDLTHELTEGTHAAVLGVIPGVSEDGSYVYFVANGSLAPGVSEGNCRSSPKPGQRAACTSCTTMGLHGKRRSSSRRCRMRTSRTGAMAEPI